jgi:hypothetical protein
MSGRDEATLELTQCPECDELAEVLDRFMLASSDGPMEHARVTCIRKHRFVMPAAGLVPEHLVKEPSGRSHAKVRRERE